MAPKPDEAKAMAEAYTAAWNSGDPERVAAHYEPDGRISINGGDSHRGTAAITEMAAGFMAEFPDLKLSMDFYRVSEANALFCWTLEGHHSASGNPVKIGGWEAWLLSDGPRVRESHGYFDAEDYDRQVQGG